jgi:predicted membrane protein
MSNNDYHEKTLKAIFGFIMLILCIEIILFVYDFNYFIGSLIVLLMIGIGLFSHKYSKSDKRGDN